MSADRPRDDGPASRPHRPIAWLVLLGVFLVTSVHCNAPSGRLVLLVVVDTLRADHLGAYGYPDVETPVIDALAAEGTLYEQAVTTVPLTLPSVASIVSGTYPVQHGIRDNGPYALADAWQTLPEQLSGMGFATGAFVSSDVLGPGHGLEQGFDVYDADFAGAYRTVDPALAVIEDERHGLERRADATIDRVLAWLESNRSRDAFALVHLFDPHVSRDPPEPFATRYAHNPYDGEIAFVDHELGRLLSFARHWAPEKRLVVFVADHGEGLGDHGEEQHGFLLHEATMHVPLIVAGMGTPKDTRASLVSIVDIFPEICARIGSAVPDGVAGVALSATDDARGGRPALLETFRPRLTYGWSELRGLRTDRWKLVVGPEVELFDLASDPNEWNDRVAEFPQVADSLHRAMDRLALGLAAGVRHAPRATPATEEDRARLASLGYVMGREPPAPTSDSLAVWLFPEETRGPRAGLSHPKRQIGAFERRQKAKFLYKSGQHAHEEGRATEAQALYRAAIMHDDALPQPIIGLARIETARGAHDAAIARLERAARRLPNKVELSSALVSALLASGRSDRAARIAEEHVTAGTADAYMHRLLASIHLERGESDRALARIRHATTVHPENAELWLDLAALARDRRDTETCRLALDRARTLSPQSPRVRFLAALLAWDSGDLAAARDHARAALEGGLAPADTARARAILEERPTAR